MGIGITNIKKLTQSKQAKAVNKVFENFCGKIELILDLYK